MIIKLLIIFILIKNQILKNQEQNLKIIPNKEITIVENNIISKKKLDEEEQPIGYLEIDAINLYKELYNISSKHNNIEENVTILKESSNPENKDSLIILAAHSGEGKIAYFNNLNKLKINDKIKFIYYNKEYIFKVTNIFEQDKIGYININKKEESQLILTTCSISNKNKQLIIESTKI